MWCKLLFLFLKFFLFPCFPSFFWVCFFRLGRSPSNVWSSLFSCSYVRVQQWKAGLESVYVAKVLWISGVCFRLSDGKSYFMQGDCQCQNLWAFSQETFDFPWEEKSSSLQCVEIPSCQHQVLGWGESRVWLFHAHTVNTTQSFIPALHYIRQLQFSTSPGFCGANRNGALSCFLVSTPNHDFLYPLHILHSLHIFQNFVQITLLMNLSPILFIVDSMRFSSLILFNGLLEGRWDICVFHLPSLIYHL